MNSHVEIYLHFVWGTWNREPFILPSFERDLWIELRNEVLKHNCRLLALGGTENHVHLLVQIHSTLNIADFVRQVKGTTSLWVNDQIRPEFQFKWQGAYGAFSVGVTKCRRSSTTSNRRKNITPKTLLLIFTKKRTDPRRDRKAGTV